MKVVFDTNIYVSLMLGSRTITRLFQHWLQGDFELYLSEPILAELIVVMRYDRIRKRKLDISLEELLAVLQEKAILITQLPKIPILSDPDDTPILATAIAAEADYLVTGNIKHFPSPTGQANNIQIISPRSLLEILS